MVTRLPLYGFEPPLPASTESCTWLAGRRRGDGDGGAVSPSVSEVSSAALFQDAAAPWKRSTQGGDHPEHGHRPLASKTLLGGVPEHPRGQPVPRWLALDSRSASATRSSQGDHPDDARGPALYDFR